MTREQGTSPEEAEKESIKFEAILAAEGIKHAEIKNCIVVPEGESLTALDIMSAAKANEAFIDNETTDEAGDDTYAVQFPGEEQKLLERDGIEAAIRHMTEGYIE